MRPTEITIKVSLSPGGEGISEGQATISAEGLPEPQPLEKLMGTQGEVSQVPTPSGELGAVFERYEGEVPTPLIEEEQKAAIAVDDLGLPVPTEEPVGATGIDQLEEPSPLAGESAIPMPMEEGEETEPLPEPQEE